MDASLSSFARRSQSDPDDQQSRLRLYQELIRCGQASQRSLELAAQHGDGTAQRLFAGINQAICRSAADVAEMAKLPIKSAGFQRCTWLKVEDLKALGSGSLQALNATDCRGPVLAFLNENFPIAPLKSLALKETLRLPELPNFQRWPLEELKLGLVFPSLGSSDLIWQHPSLKRLELILPIHSDKGLNLLRGLKLEELTLTSPVGNRLSGNLSALTEMPLKALSLKRCDRFKANSFLALSQQPLEALDFANSGLTDADLRSFKRHAIHHLNLKNCPNIRLQTLLKLDNWALESLDLSGHILSAKVFQWIQKQPLKSLSLDNCQRCNDVKLLSQSSLEQLSLKGISVSSQSLKHLPYHSLKSLSLSIGPGFDHSQIERLRGAKLEQLEVTCHGSPTFTQLKAFQGLPVTSLSLGGLEELTDEAFEILRAMPLKSLALGPSKALGDEALTQLSSCPLERLEIDSWPRLSDKGLIALAGLPLQYLRIRGCPRLTDLGLPSLVKTPLRRLRFDFCPQISKQVFNGMSICGTY